MVTILSPLYFTEEEMPKATLKHPNESFDSLFRRFKRAVEKSDVIRECQERQQYEKPSAKRKKARAAATKRTQRMVNESKLPKKLF